MVPDAETDELEPNGAAVTAASAVSPAPPISPPLTAEPSPKGPTDEAGCNEPACPSSDAVGAAPECASENGGSARCIDDDEAGDGKVEVPVPLLWCCEPGTRGCHTDRSSVPGSGRGVPRASRAIATLTVATTSACPPSPANAEAMAVAAGCAAGPPAAGAALVRGAPRPLPP